MGESNKNPLSDISSKLAKLLSSYNQLIVAYSGGMDSVVLLHLLATNHQLRDKITAVYINHGINSQADQWDKFCKKTCEALMVDYLSQKINHQFSKTDRNLEKKLRDARYEAFSSLTPNDSCLITAHHADDQAETVLLQLFRGSGIKGLAAMSEKTTIQHTQLIRPLLAYPKAVLLAYANHHNLSWIEDDSNYNTNLRRNFVRHELLPLVKKKWPGVNTILNRTAKLASEATQLINLVAKQDLISVLNQNNRTIDILLLKNLTQIRQKNLLRYWLSELKLPIPSEVKINEVIKNAIYSNYDSLPIVTWNGGEVRRFKNNLYAMSPLIYHNPQLTLSYHQQPIVLPGDLGTLCLEIPNGLSAEAITITFRNNGELIQLDGRQGKRKLKKLMQEWQIPPWLRNRIPLIYCKEKLISVVGYYDANGFKSEITPSSTKRDTAIN